MSANRYKCDTREVQSETLPAIIDRLFLSASRVLLPVPLPVDVDNSRRVRYIR